MDYLKHLPTIFLALLFNACQSNAQHDIAFEEKDYQKFNDYWYAGKAELTNYTLQQSRYGEVHEGHAVLIFVTEDFSKEKQVKLDRPDQAKNDAVKVMKLNFTKKFNTGIYPYSMMSSTFTPVQRDQFPNSFKVTSSSQEWCGHTFTQLNLRKNNFDLSGFSYFESEGDLDKEIDKVLLEDEVWNLIRLNPEQLPVGTIEIIPGTFASRLMHTPLQKVNANAKLSNSQNEDFKGENVLVYEIQYEKPQRILNIYFEKNFPHQILGWEEEYKGTGGKQLTTKAVQKKSMQLDYWRKNSPEDESLRKELGLD
ncbi:hypothetical protein QQ008_20570 [Fulvivirgaceae bacterium BMA10]|uniref:Septum formation inhibitor Maf n=1 Tax=Splendidivirga corallicola TaxID=3051826 RepID=A0ABT8KSR3_9BACT|nr:hypothetical protein [Fulvivirgaceae bacterium BMA10]